MYANKHNTVTPIIHNSVLMVILFFMLFLSGHEALLRIFTISSVRRR